MEMDLQNAVGKTAGEIARDFAEFLSLPFSIDSTDLRDLPSGLNIHEQFSFALLKEAELQGWTLSAAENFYKRVCAAYIAPGIGESVLAAFRVPQGDAYKALEAKYRSDFSLTDNTYWSACLSIGIPARQAGTVLKYLQAFTVCIMEFAYMGGKTPEKTYVWGYYDSFRKILEELNRETDVTSPLVIKGIGGCSGNRQGNSYYLSVGVDLENPNKKKIACGVEIDITLKDASGEVISTIADRINVIDPGSVFHYGITKKIQGNPTVNISAVAKTDSFLPMTVDAMKGIKLSGVSQRKNEQTQTLVGSLTNTYPTSLNGFAVYYQYLSKESKILGGGNEWIFDCLDSGATVQLQSEIGMQVKNASKIVYSIDFDLKELLKD